PPRATSAARGMRPRCWPPEPRFVVTSGELNRSVRAKVELCPVLIGNGSVLRTLPIGWRRPAAVAGQKTLGNAGARAQPAARRRPTRLDVRLGVFSQLEGSHSEEVHVSRQDLQRGRRGPLETAVSGAR